MKKEKGKEYKRKEKRVLGSGFNVHCFYLRTIIIIVLALINYQVWNSVSFMAFG